MKVSVTDIKQLKGAMEALRKQATKYPDHAADVILRHGQKEVPIRCKIDTAMSPNHVIWSYKMPGKAMFTLSTWSAIFIHAQIQFGWKPVVKE